MTTHTANTVQLYSGRGWVALLVLHLVLLVALGHEVPPWHLPGVLAPSSWTFTGTVVDSSKVWVVATLGGKPVFSLPKTVCVAP